ncbi:hypothetical protein CRI94_03730 [Longibacter salinarum]|uniref:Lipoprotein n=1 Tax=Longibacter salinarum TaxID=1850348 RepID=A0A2A8CZP1_9BACT|nr:hypothetical protein [Longibacter salinarum]PEN14162.1 hypothetical protein CRI94_03730 [Longibacter salinarum]
MNRLSKLALVLVLLAFAVTACAPSEQVTQSYRGGENAWVYETSSVRLSDVTYSSGLNEPNFEVDARAECPDTQCPPEEYVLRFRLDSGAERVEITSTDVRLWVDGERLDWENPFPYPEDERRSVRGTLVQITATKDQFKKIAESEEVRGKLGGFEFTLFYDSRAPFRAMIDKVNPDTSDPDSPAA